MFVDEAIASFISYGLNVHATVHEHVHSQAHYIGEYS